MIRTQDPSEDIKFFFNTKDFKSVLIQNELLSHCKTVDFQINLFIEGLIFRNPAKGESHPSFYCQARFLGCSNQMVTNEFQGQGENTTTNKHFSRRLLCQHFKKSSGF